MNFFKKIFIISHNLLFIGKSYFYDLQISNNQPLFDPHYGEVGYFAKKNFHTRKYKFANWGSRIWEYYYAEFLLNQINIKNKQVIDIGIGLPDQYTFYKYYLKSKCNLTAYDPDDRFKKIHKLSSKCKILRHSAEHMNQADNSVDVVVALSALEHFSYKVFKKTIKETYRVLKPNGHFIVTLDMTYDRRSSARWAILEKTYNGLPEGENDLCLKRNHIPITIPKFLELVAPYFYVKNNSITNANLPIDEIVYCKRWNSHIGYLHLFKDA